MIFLCKTDDDDDSVDVLQVPLQSSNKSSLRNKQKKIRRLVQLKFDDNDEQHFSSTIFSNFMIEYDEKNKTQIGYQKWLPRCQ